MSLKKKDGITGLNTSHALYSKIARFVVFDDTIKDLVSNQVYTSTAIVVDDTDIGNKVREFDTTDDALSPTLPISINNTMLMIYKHMGPSGVGILVDNEMFFAATSGNEFRLEAATYSGYDYRIYRRGAFGTTYETAWRPYNSQAVGGAGITARRLPHAMTVDYVSDASSMWINGALVPVFSGTAAPTFTPNVNPIQGTIAKSVKAASGTTNAAYRLAGLVIFNTVLTDEEKTIVTTTPWDLVVGTLPLEVSLSSALTPGATITATLVNYPSLPTTVTVADSRGNDITLPLTATGATTATFTVPALAGSNTGIEYIQFGAVNLTFGAKTISSTFNPVSPLSYVTLIAPVATNAFEAWGASVPVANEQLTSEGNFDVNGNFTGADPDTTYTCWITRLDGTNHRFTVQQGAVGVVATPAITPTSGTYSAPVTVTISTATYGATLRYTTNGTDVTSGSTLYSAPFNVAASATVKARGFKDGLSDSAQSSQVYLINTPGPVSDIDELGVWQAEYTHALRINQIIDATGINVVKVSVQQQEYIYALKVNEIITALGLPIKLLSVQQQSFMTALTINQIINALESVVYGLNFNKSSIYGTLANRVIDVTGDIEIEFYTPDYIGTAGFSQSIVAQCAASTFTAQEFELYFSGGSGNIVVNIGGAITSVLLSGTFTASTQYRIVLSGATSTVYNMAGGVVRTVALTRGAAREPAAAVTIGARFNGTSMVEYFGGVQRDLKINGVLWSMSSRDQAVQPSTPTGNSMTITGATSGDWVTVS